MANRLIVILLGGTLLTGLISVILIASLKEPLEESPFNRQEFDDRVWHSYHMSMDRDSLRGAMANDVMQKLLNERPTQDEVLKVLGEPDLARKANLFSYHLGMWSNHRSRVDSLDISFGQDGRVQTVRFVGH